MTKIYYLTINRRTPKSLIWICSHDEKREMSTCWYRHSMATSRHLTRRMEVESSYTSISIQEMIHISF